MSTAYGAAGNTLREYALREFWEIFVDDSPFCHDACFKHANVQPERSMDGNMNRTEWDQISQHVWICSKEVLTRGQLLSPEMEEYLKNE